MPRKHKARIPLGLSLLFLLVISLPSLRFPAHAAALPDLTVDSIWLEESSAPGQPVTAVAPSDQFLIVASIRNIGDASASGYYLDVYYDSDYGRGGPDIIAPGETQIWYVGPLTAQAGSHVTKWIVDPDNQIAESNETNNEKDYTFTIGSQTTTTTTSTTGSGSTSTSATTTTSTSTVTPTTRTSTTTTSSTTSSTSTVTPTTETSTTPTITHVAGQSGRGTATTGSTISITMALTPTNGNILILTYVSYVGTSKTISSISQSGVTWSGSGNGKQVSLFDNGDIEIWLGTVGAGASTSITVTLSATYSTYEGGICNVYEYSGLAAASSVLDKTKTSATGQYSTTTDTGTTATTTQANELWVGTTFSTKGSSTDQTQTKATNGFTLYDGTNLVSSTEYISSAFLEKIVSSTGTADSGTTVANQGYWDGCIATFKAAAAGPTTTSSTSTVTPTTQTSTTTTSSTTSSTVSSTASSTSTTSSSIIAGSIVSVTDAPDPVTRGRTVTFSVTINNHGNMVWSGASINIKLYKPDGTFFATLLLTVSIKPGTYTYRISWKVSSSAPTGIWHYEVYVNYAGVLIASSTDAANTITVR